MKRPLGLIGITYLLVLAAVFYFYSTGLVAAALCVSAAAVCFGFVFMLFRRKSMFSYCLITIGLTAFCAAAALFIYQNYYIEPIIDNYSDKEISIEGYVCDEISLAENYAVFPIQTEKINGEKKRLRMNVTLYSEYDIEEFDKISAVMHAYYSDYNYAKGRQIILAAYEDEDFSLTATGQKHFTPYKYAVSVRKAMKNSLESLMSKDGAALSKAILFGDKQALSAVVRNDFTKTGTSFLIVVSGMHLSVAIWTFSFILKRFTKRKVIINLGAIAAIFSFTALTGFAPSVSRAAIMLSVAYLGNLLTRNSDSLNSLGIAAIILTAPNPFSVGDIGMLMSFSATTGIILWAKPINEFIAEKLRINKIPIKKIRDIINFFTNLIAVSVSASIWIMPITIAAFNRISPLVVIIAFITEPIASLVLICALFAALLYLIPYASFISYPFAFAADFLCQLHIRINSLFAALPFCSVKTDKLYIYIWLTVTALLVIIGYVIKAKKLYAGAAIAVSAMTIALGWSLTVLTEDYSTEIEIYQSGYGLTVAVEKNNNISLLSCGGSDKNKAEITEDLSEIGGYIDSVIIPSKKYYSNCLKDFAGKFEFLSVYINEKYIDDIETNLNTESDLIKNNAVFTLKINSDTTNTVINANDVTYQYVSSKSSSFLFVPRGGDIEKLPDKFRSANYVLLDGTAENYNLLKCGRLIYAGNINKELINNYTRLNNICDEFIALRDDCYEIKLK